MSETTVAKPVEKIVEFIPFGSDDPIKLSAQIVKDYLVTPTKAGHLPTMRDCVNFIALCKSGKLNPFTREAFLVGYDTRDQGPKWQLITAEIAFLRRAEHHPHYDGVRHGVIVMDQEEKIVERAGDFMHPKDTLLGGWAIVSRKDRKEVEEARVNLPTYSTNMSRWAADPAGMIVKVARCQALRRAFPNFLGGLYTREELQLAVPTDETSVPIDNGNHVEEPKQLPEKRLPKEPVQELEQIVVAAQCRWDHFLEFLMVSGNYSEAKEAKSFDEIPAELATRLLRGAKQLLQELNRIKNKPVDESTDKFKAMHEHVEKSTKKEVAT